MKELRSRLYPVGKLLNPKTPYVPAAAQTVERLRERFERERKRLESEAQVIHIRRKA